jgi:hypothetical protein
MEMGNATHWGALLTAMCIAGTADAQECRAVSGPQRAALVELYTSEGCSSCPPADRQLSRLGAPAGGFTLGKDLVPLAWHVDFWDYIGWKDPFARAEFTARQRALAAANGSRTLYTPHFFVGGREIRDRSRVEAAIRSHNAERAAADIRIAAAFSGDGRSQLALRIEGARAGGADAPAVLHVAVTESGLENRIAVGENRGATLKHDHVVRHWLGPIPLEAGTATLARTLALTPEQSRKGVAVVAFVQDTRSGEVLQAASTGPCKLV